jgi:hypothetical protein
MGLQDIALSGYDMVVSVTQRALNVGLDGWVRAQDTQVELTYLKDDQGDYVLATPDTATLVFTGALAMERDPVTKMPVDIITLWPSSGPRTVQYNATFTGGTFTDTLQGVTLTQGNAVWVARYTVQIAIQPVTMDQLPSGLQQQVQSGVGGLGPDAFAIQQVWADLNTAELAAFDGFEGLTEAASSDLDGVLRAYLRQQQEKGGMVFGYGVQCTDATAAAPTLMPTALDFSVTPYDAQGTTSNPLDTLNYLLMTQNHPLPAGQAAMFPFRFVDDIAISGAIAIRHDLFASQVAMELSGILPTMSPVLHADAHADHDSGAITVTTGGWNGGFDVFDPPQGNTVAASSYSPGPVSDHVSFFIGHTTVTAQVSSTCSIQFGIDGNNEPNPSVILLSGAVTFSGDINSTGTSSGIETVIPTTTSSWYAELAVQADLTTTGQLDLVVGNSDFTSDPVIQGDAPGFWDRIFSALSHDMQNYADGITGLRTEVQAQVVDQVPGALQATLAQANHFVFPGGETFLFSQPQFPPSCDLVADISYQD